MVKCNKITEIRSYSVYIYIRKEKGGTVYEWM